MPFGTRSDDIQEAPGHIMVATSIRIWNKLLDAGTSEGLGADIAFLCPDRDIKPVADLAVHLDDDR